LPHSSPERGFFSSEVLQLLECHFFLGHFRRTGRAAHFLLTLVGFRADLVFAEATAAFAKSPREGAILFKDLLPRIARPFFRTQAPHFPVIVGRRRCCASRWINNPPG
jgi:hypothetical protein